MGLSENVVYPIVPNGLLIIIPMKNGYFIGNINPTFSDKPIFSSFQLQFWTLESLPDHRKLLPAALLAPRLLLLETGVGNDQLLGQMRGTQLPRLGTTTSSIDRSWHPVPLSFTSKEHQRTIGF